MIFAEKQKYPPRSNDFWNTWSFSDWLHHYIWLIHRGDIGRSWSVLKADLKIFIFSGDNNLKTVTNVRNRGVFRSGISGTICIWSHKILTGWCSLSWLPHTSNSLLGGSSKWKQIFPVLLHSNFTLKLKSLQTEKQHLLFDQKFR